MSLIVVSLALLLGMPEVPASARYGAFTIHTYLRSGTSGWVGEGDAPTITRRVAPGNGVSFEVLGRGHGMPVPDPRAFGCASTDGIDVRYLLATPRGDRDITEAIVGTGWTRVASFDRWRVRIRVAFRVGADVPSGTTLSCRVAINRDPVRAVVTVR